MKNVLAILAVAFVATAPALAADSIASTDDDEEPTMGELAEDIAELSGKLDTVLRAVGNLAPEVAVVMTIPTRLFSGGGWYKADYYLVGESTISGFPAAVDANGKFNSEHGILPQGTYLFEMQQPYSDKLICQGSTPLLNKGRGPTGTAGHRRGRGSQCPSFSLHVKGETYNDGPVVSAVSAAGVFQVRHRFPGITFTDQRPMSSYRGGLKITKLK